MITAERRRIEEQLIRLDRDISLLEKKLSDQENILESIGSTYRRIHNLKSSLFLMDLNESLKHVYLLEQIFEKLRTGNMILSAKALDAFSDTLQWIKGDLGISEQKNADRESLIDRLKDLLASEESQLNKTRSFNLTSDEKALLRDARNSNLNIFLVEQSLDTSISRESYRDLPLFNKINEIGMIAVKTPEYINLKAATKDSNVPLKVIFITDRKQKDMKDPLLKAAVPFEDDLYLTQRDYKILIIEDNPVARLLQKSIMSDFGVCDTVNDGEAGINLFTLALEENSPYHIILLDLVMPGIGGSEVLSRIREIEEEHKVRGLDRSKVIVSTTTTESSTLMDLFRAEADAYIFKPMTKEKITREMSNLKLI
ncbi:response regulator [Spirochaeta isovalerica]|uniref:CheY-like chemotaxis protein n=1 Tax=Spirochaeta isovalerica TaxID=150 RepID=A0A841R6D6_9SPIO|nr:response regulator [Spirochaeta isovalerica]MBB6478610.1 CheY-like chemotaxis protein [Spirochaeta isovalerica]